ncbi:unnamed protein product [Soboliphyme baturini]|uniref:Amino_oxidase domain-containing protein n=1 Tax=Soboliphyme baturini TaxID=241478 RepID=A0A183IMX4_9BILA|nr:unnamed protein product [Soboliphyme baturini]
MRVVGTDYGSGGRLEIFPCDAVLVTVPLGVLKYSVDRTIEPSLKQLRFIPPLPSWKIAAINGLGFGNLNKVALFFEHIFWNTDTDTFGHVNSINSARGENFLFWSLYQKPVLICLMAGEAADCVEGLGDAVVVEHTLAVLKSIFGDSLAPLSHSTVTRWKSDPCSQGSYSYVSVDATDCVHESPREIRSNNTYISGDDYDTLAAPVVFDVYSNPSQLPRVFFAGEHTCREYPATVHGALLSGLREAARIANTFQRDI